MQMKRVNENERERERDFNECLNRALVLPVPSREQCVRAKRFQAQDKSEHKISKRRAAANSIKSPRRESAQLFSLRSDAAFSFSLAFLTFSRDLHLRARRF